MASQETVDLIRLGPFKGLDSRSAGPFADPQSAAALSNADLHALTGALSTARGRVGFQQFLNLGGPIAQVAAYIVSPSRIFFVVQTAAGVTNYYDYPSGNFGTLSSVSTPFTDAVQSNGILWLNNGQQVFLGPDNLLHAALWNYPAPSGTAFGYAVNTQAGSPLLAAATYSYAFVQVVSIPNIDGTVKQFTTATGATEIGTSPVDGSPIFPYQVVQDGTSQNAISGIFAGTTPDGYSYVTNVYRYSNANPFFYLLTTLTANGTFADSAAAGTITGNAQLIASTNQNQDPPPTGGPFNSGLNPIEAHQDRMWTLAVVNDTSTNGFPQTQVWYSREGEPWSFDQINQALLVEDEDTTLLSGSPGTDGIIYGNQPVALSSEGSALMVWRRSTTSMVYGVDQATYQVLKLFSDIGCIAPLSVTTCAGSKAWQAAQGIFTFDGSSLNRISEQMTNFLRALGPAALEGCVGFFKSFSQTLYFSYPAANVTLKYYMPKQQWEVLPYATTSAWTSTSMPSDLTGTPLDFGMIAAGRPGTPWLDFWDAAYTDLGLPITATFTSQETDSEAAHAQKTYTGVLLNAPLQPAGVIADMALYIDEKLVQEWEDIDLSVGPTTKVFRTTNENGVRGYLAQLVVSVTNIAGATGAAVIYSAKVGGTAPRLWSQPS